MIVVTAPTPVASEWNLMNSLFEAGLALLHIRKPSGTEDEMRVYLEKIKPEFRDRLVLHQQHHLAQDFQIRRIHFTENERKSTTELAFQNWIKEGFTLSTSVHSMSDFEQLAPCFQYAFFGPVFESLSKPGYVSTIEFEKTLKSRQNKTTALLAIGGITAAKIQTALQFGFDGVALLGTIWNTQTPIEIFKLCQKNALLY
jgi:thiamine-phosphate pyrophosphorylase